MFFAAHHAVKRDRNLMSAAFCRRKTLMSPELFVKTILDPAEGLRG
jgi:hypothetical protein